MLLGFLVFSANTETPMAAKVMISLTTVLACKLMLMSETCRWACLVCVPLLPSLIESQNLLHNIDRSEVTLLSWSRYCDVLINNNKRKIYRHSS